MIDPIDGIHAEAMQKRGYNAVKLAFIDYLVAKRDYKRSPIEFMRNFKSECLAAYKAACEVYEAVFDEEWTLTDSDRATFNIIYKDVFGGEI